MTQPHAITDLRAWTTLEPRQGSGVLYVRGRLDTPAALVRCRLEREGTTISEERFSPADFQEGVSLRDLQIRCWWPNGAGEQPMYLLRVELLDRAGAVLDTATLRVGFKYVAWPLDAEVGAPEVCVVNDRPIAIRLADWADADDLARHQAEGVNLLRVATLEPEDFYQRCDALGLMVWQVLPAGAPPAAIARRQHHVSLLLWSGDPAQHEAVVSDLDPTRRLLPTQH